MDSKSFTILWKGNPVGIASNLTCEHTWLHGEFTLLPGGQSLAEFFNWMTDETKGWTDPPFGDDLLSPENWEVEDASGKRHPIEVPAVKNLSLISWRWR